MLMHQKICRERSNRRILDDEQFRNSEVLAAEARQDDLLNLINKQREDWKLPPLVLSEELSDLARLQAISMKKKKAACPIASRQHELCHLLDSRQVAESCASGLSIPDIYMNCALEQPKVFNAKNRLTRKLIEVGIGTVKEKDGTIFVCQLFRGQTRS